MNIARLKISANIKDKLTAYLCETISFEYKNISHEMAILATEEFYFRNNSNQLNMIVMKTVDSYMFVDLIGGGGGSGLFAIDWGSERSFTKNAREIIENFCDTNNEPVEEVELEQSDE